ncbi:MAG: inositol monophosphatase [Planctomycetes bacterium]|nr:inositol monophosphatase [Planctomycetota bacterium]
MSIDLTTARAWAQRLEAIGLAVRDRLVRAREAGQDMASAVAQEGGDTIFAIDRHVEPVIERAIEAWPAECKPLALVAEGFGEQGHRSFGDPRERARFRVIIDPIDGTRGIMYDKRSAWFLAAVAVERGEATGLRDAFAAVMVELPTGKQGFADVFSAVRGGGASGWRDELTGGRARKGLSFRPSTAPTLRHGWAQVANFFPGTKVLAAELMERIAAATLERVVPGEGSIFDDQYMTTGGQMVELMVGHDRFCCDLRPLFYSVLEAGGQGRVVRGLECHPYDCAGALIAEEAGVILTDGFGRPLNAPMDVHSGVHWCGYANGALRARIEPVIQRFFAERGVTG